jgi:hypothetical protein
MICSSLAAEALPGLSFPALLALAMASRPTFPQVMVISQLTTRVAQGSVYVVSSWPPSDAAIDSGPGRS